MLSDGYADLKKQFALWTRSPPAAPSLQRANCFLKRSVSSCTAKTQVSIEFYSQSTTKL